MSDPKQKPDFWWPIITDSKSASKVSSGAAAACYVVSGVNLIVAIVAICVGRPVRLGMGGVSGLFDAVVLGILGYLIGKRRSRVAAVLATVLFVGEKIYLFGTLA
jgi:hypothetical protein